MGASPETAKWDSGAQRAIVDLTAITLTPDGSTFRIAGGTSSADVRMVPGAWPVHCSPRTQFKIDVAA